jgi:GDP-4-dehydro-6-deoxy-D-mannose reductase
MTRLFVTGASGFVGRHLESAVGAGNFGACEWFAASEELDIRDAGATLNAVESVRPDAVVHLAARSFVPESFADPRGTFEVNLVGTLNVLQALKSVGFRGRMIFVSSGDIYGHVPDAELPIDERRLPEPRSPYAVSKLASEQLTLQWHRTEGLDAIVARPFNHVGPGQDSRFVLPALAKQVIAITNGEQPPVIEVGDIDTTRDFTDVRDVVAAYAAMLQSGRPGRTYVVGSGRERRVRELLAEMCRLAGVTAEIHQDSSRMRPAEQRRMVANAGLLERDTGWTPRVSLENTLLDILDDARRNR